MVEFDDTSRLPQREPSVAGSLGHRAAGGQAGAFSAVKTPPLTGAILNLVVVRAFYPFRDPRTGQWDDSRGLYGWLVKK